MTVLERPAHLVWFDKNMASREKSGIAKSDSPWERKGNDARLHPGGRRGHTTASFNKEESVTPSNFVFIHKVYMKTRD